MTAYLSALAAVDPSLKLQRITRLNRWTIGAVLAAILVFLPIGAVVFLSFGDSGDIWPHLLRTALPEYVGTTLWLLLGVGLSVFLTGVTTAWLVTMCRFPGRRVFEWLLLLPLAIPAYVMAYAYTDLLEYAGPVQTALRALFGWQSARDYFFPPVRSLGGAIMFMGLVLYPYVYLLARSAFLEQSVNVLEVSRVLGKGPWQTFRSISFPAARPAIVVGVSLALMETLNDYGTVDFFAVYTMTAGLIDVWLGMGSLTGGAQIATSMLVFVILLIALERISRRHQRVYQQASSRFRALPAYPLSGWRSAVAIGLCALPVVAGFIVPISVLGHLSVVYFDRSWTSEFKMYAFNSLALSAGAALITLMAALFIVYARRLKGGRVLGVATRIASLGYAVPGAVLAVGILIPFAAFDNALDAFLRKTLGVSTGLLLSGTVAAVMFAYMVRFLAVAVGQVDSSLEKVSPSMDMAARTLGFRAGATLVRYHLPLIKGGLFTAAMVVFVDCMKELPATLLLRPFNFETLATYVYRFASDEMLGEAALGSLTIVAVGLLPVLFLSRMISRSRQLNAVSSVGDH